MAGDRFILKIGKTGVARMLEETRELTISRDTTENQNAREMS